MTTITKTVQSLKCVIRTNRSCNLHSTVTALQMYNVYRKNRSREMILKSIATNINGKLLLAAKIIRFFSFLNAESLKFLWSHLRAQKKRKQSNRRQGVYLVRFRAHAHVPNETDMKSTPFRSASINARHFSLRDALELLKIVSLYFLSVVVVSTFQLFSIISHKCLKLKLFRITRNKDNPFITKNNSFLKKLVY